MKRAPFIVCLALVFQVATFHATAQEPDEDGFVSLFDGKTLDGWTVPKGDNGHWKVVDGVIDYDANSESPDRDKNLWSEKEYGDFILKIDWRIKQHAGKYPMPIILPDGTHLQGPDGKDITIKLPNADSGVYLRGVDKAQVNIWCWPIGSGEVYGYRMDKSMPPEVRAGVTPKINADNPVGEWNTFIIIVVGDRLSVVLNNKQIITNAQLPGLPSKGKISLQHHGGFRNGQYSPGSSLVQFRNISIKELD
jgi:hypothetical protein